MQFRQSVLMGHPVKLNFVTRKKKEKKYERGFLGQCFSARFARWSPLYSQALVVENSLYLQDFTRNVNLMWGHVTRVHNTGDECTSPELAFMFVGPDAGVTWGGLLSQCWEVRGRGLSEDSRNIWIQDALRCFQRYLQNLLKTYLSLVTNVLTYKIVNVSEV